MIELNHQGGIRNTSATLISSLGCVRFVPWCCFWMGRRIVSYSQLLWMFLFEWSFAMLRLVRCNKAGNKKYENNQMCSFVSFLSSSFLRWYNPCALFYMGSTSPKHRWHYCDSKFGEYRFINPFDQGKQLSCSHEKDGAVHQILHPCNS